MASSEKLVQARGISVRLGGTWILRGLSFDIERGECLYLAGHNGAGKTTLLRVLATLQRYHRGELSIGGHDARKGRALIRETLGYAGHDHQFYAALSCRDNLRLWADYWRVPKERVESALEEVALGAAADRAFRALSAGMKRRLGLARLSLQDNPLMLFDEPFAQLDSQGVEEFQAFIRRRHQAGATLIFTTHHAPWGQVLADRTLQMEAGEFRVRSEAEEKA